MNIIYVYIWVIAYIKSQIASFEIYQLQNLFFFLLLLLLMAMGFESRALCNHSTTWARPPALLFLFCFWDKVIFTLLGWPQTCDVCLLRSWDYRCASSYLDTKSFFSESYGVPLTGNLKNRTWSTVLPQKMQEKGSQLRLTVISLVGKGWGKAGVLCLVYHGRSLE
jgi:hypothetical protein